MELSVRPSILTLVGAIHALEIVTHNGRRSRISPDANWSNQVRLPRAAPRPVACSCAMPLHKARWLLVRFAFAQILFEKIDQTAQCCRVLPLAREI